MRLAERIAVVTGGARGIGRGIAEAVAREGACVVIADLDLATADRAASELPLHTTKGHLAIEVDVSSSPSVRDLFQKIHKSFGALHILVNNAGICPLAGVEDISEEEWDHVLGVNLKGAFLCSQAALPLLKKSAPARIINISSVAGKMGALVAGAHYTASKAGMLGLTWSLARCCAKHDITVNAVAPSIVETELTDSWSAEQRETLQQSIPLGRLGRPEDIGEAVVFLASHEAGFITGEVLDVNGGFLMD